jgi:hypothetical protein
LGIGGWGSTIANVSIATYVVGVVWGLLVIDARPPARVALALLWPIGPLAFTVTITILLAASLIAFPVWGVAVAISVLAYWLWVA